MQEIRPDVVFHAAALKHLPLLQSHPAEALKTNVWGTVSVLRGRGRSRRVALRQHLDRQGRRTPCSVLGYSKRIAEALTAHFGQQRAGQVPQRPLRQRARQPRVGAHRPSAAQLDAGRPLTVTDPEVTRYFMTVEEAVQLVIQAGAIGSDGEALVLDMGEPVRIADVARQLASSRYARGPDHVHRAATGGEAARGPVLQGRARDADRAPPHPPRRRASAESVVRREPRDLWVERRDARDVAGSGAR